MATRLEIIRGAQARVGDELIEAEDEPGADTYVAIYEAKVEDILSRYPWAFATVVRRLTRLSQKPVAHWQYLYQLPSEMIGSPRAVYDSDTLRMPYTRYELLENRLATDAETIWLRFTKKADSTLWPGYFTELITLAIMTDLALSVREDHVMYARLREVTYGDERLMGEGGHFGQAKAIDSQGKPSAIIAEGVNPLIDARGGSSRFNTFRY